MMILEGECEVSAKYPPVGMAVREYSSWAPPGTQDLRVAGGCAAVGDDLERHREDSSWIPRIRPTPVYASRPESSAASECSSLPKAWWLSWRAFVRMGHSRRALPAGK